MRSVRSSLRSGTHLARAATKSRPARGDYHDESDIDVLVIAKVSDRKFADKVREIGYTLDEEIDYRLSIQVMSEAKIAYLRENNFQFAQSIFRDAVSA
jgi:predicted nucleotidyltransferase